MKAKKRYFVFDTNSLISAALIGTSINAKALDFAFKLGQVAVSDATFSEFIDVLYRPKFDKYLSNERRMSIIDRMEQEAKHFRIKETINSCRDPKDNKFLDLAVSAHASCLITGDQDLLVLHPFRGIPILSAADFVLMFEMS